MFRVILLTSAIALAVADPLDYFGSCIHLFENNGLECAGKEIPMTNAFGMGPKPDDSLKECYALFNESETSICPASTCIAEKKGFISADGIIDRKSIATTLEKDFEKNPLLIENIKEMCLNEDINYKNDKIACELMGVQLCIHVHMLQSIDWNDEGKCKGKRDLAEKCVQEMKQSIYE